MGLFNSRPETPTMPPFVEHHSSPMMANQPYPDMNVIFKGIPKVMQVADDMHRMTNYIEDMRNMFFGCSVITALGILAFVLLKCMKKQKRRGRRFIHHIDSEQSSLSRNGGGGGGHYRHFSRHLSNGDWAHKIVDMQDQGNPNAQTTSTTATGTIGTVSRHTPPIHNRYGVSHSSAVHPSHLPPQTAHQPIGHPQGQQQQSQDYQSSSQHSALSGNFVANGNGGGNALGMKVNASGGAVGGGGIGDNKPNGVGGANHVVVEKRKIAD